jgi:hypothetical protein
VTLEGLNPSETGKETAGRAGAGNVEAPAHTARERDRERNNAEGLDGFLSGVPRDERT